MDRHLSGIGRRPGPHERPDAHGTSDQDVAAVLGILPFRRLWLALGVSSLGDWLGLLATAALARDLAGPSYSAENLAVAGVFVLRLAPAVLLGSPAARAAARLDRRWSLVAGDLIRFAVVATIPVVGTLAWVYAATLVIGCAAPFRMPAHAASIPDLVPARRRGAAERISLVAAYGSAPVAAAAYIGVALVAEVANGLSSRQVADPIRPALYLAAVTFLVSALVIWRLPLPPGPGVLRHPRPGVLRSVLDGWRFVGRTPVVRGLATGMLAASAACVVVVGLAPTFAADLRAGQAGFGVLVGVVSAGLAAGMWSGSRVPAGLFRRRVFGLSLSVSGVFLVLLALVPDLIAATVFVLVIGACGGVAWMTGHALLDVEVDDEVRGRTFAFLRSATRVVLVLVLAAGPALAAPVGVHRLRISAHLVLTYNGAAWVFALAGVLALVMGMSAFRRLDDRRGVSLRAELRALMRVPGAGGPFLPRREGHLGLFIAFEGGDGSGKSTQARLLARWLQDDQGHEVVLTREPGATPVGVRLRELLLGHGESVGPRAEALLFAADRAHHVDTVVLPALARGDIVITDRYADSSIAYQGAGRDLDGDDVARLSRWATDALVPDLTVLLDLPPQIQKVRRAADVDRGGADRMELQPEEFHDRVRRRFLDLARRDPRRYLVIDASEPREEIQAAIRGRVRDLMPISRRRRGELAARLVSEEDARRRRASAEAEVLRLDANLRGRSRDEARARQEELRAARIEAERQVREEAERQAREAQEATDAALREAARLDEIARKAALLAPPADPGGRDGVRSGRDRVVDVDDRVELGDGDDVDDRRHEDIWSPDVLGPQPGRQQ